MLYDPVTKFTTHPCLGSWIWEVEKDILIWTEPLYHFFGLDPSDKPPLLEHQAQLYTPESFSALHDAVSKCLKTGEPYTLQLDGIHSSGRTVRLEVYGVAETDGSGKVVKLFGQVIDRTESHKAQTELQLINQQFSLAFENAPIGKAIVSLDGKLLRVNRAFAEMLGYSPEGMEKLSFQAITCEDDLAADLAYVKQLLTSEIKKYSMEKRYIHKNGTFIWAHLSVSLARDAAGNPHHFISQIQNKTEQYQKQKQLDSLLEHEKFQRLLIANMAAGVGVWEHDLINDRLIWDTQMLKLYGKSSTSDHSNYDMWVSSLHPDDKQRCQEAIRVALSGEKDFNTEFRVIWPDGSIHYIRGMARVSRDDDGVPIKMVGTNWDITEEIEKQQLLEEATEKALAADRVKSEFLGVMSHELRTPLSAIIGFANLTLEDKRLPPEIRDNIAIIEESGNSLLRILEDILDFSRVEAMGVKLQSVPFSISELAWKVIRLVEEAAAAKKLQLFVELGEGLPGTLQGDPERIQQVLLNLLRNAVKFTEKGKITLSVSLLSGDGDSYRLRFAIEDTGLGISEEQQKRIFLPFTQADGSSSRRHDGVGLGLAISKRLVENMGSTIFLKSQVGKGSIFFFEIVLASGTSTKMERTEHAEDLGHLDNGFARRFPARILIVEDNLVNLKIVLLLLEKLGYENIRTASNGKEALAVLEGEEIDLIFMDLQMPVIDGLDATRKIRSLEAEHPSVFHPRTIVALTANSSPAIRNQCFEVGMNDYISKPINTIALAKAIALRQ